MIIKLLYNFNWRMHILNRQKLFLYQQMTVEKLFLPTLNKSTRTQRMQNRTVKPSQTRAINTEQKARALRGRVSRDFYEFLLCLNANTYYNKEGRRSLFARANNTTSRYITGVRAKCSAPACDGFARRSAHVSFRSNLKSPRDHFSIPSVLCLIARASFNTFERVNELSNSDCSQKKIIFRINETFLTRDLA